MDEPQKDLLLKRLSEDDDEALLQFSGYDYFIDLSLTGKVDKQDFWQAEFIEMNNGVYTSDQQSDILIKLDKKIDQLKRLQERLVKNRNEYRTITDTYSYTRFANIDGLTLASDCRRGKFLAREADFLCKEIQYVLAHPEKVANNK
jgi:hypothetical protein